MTQAVCWKCGSIKFGAFCPCPECGATPETEDDLVISLAMTDHYFDIETLRQFGQSIEQNGRPPNLDPETRENLLQVVRGAGEVIAGAGHAAGIPPGLASSKKPWWKFW